ncbi:hypothetical protein Cgig2_013844 [Carnegiea gigantea]|uniref:Uncharacterized protein n=1 Tax=Carnegiea gigantea TaxID=171969 RepID=A0A9Q1JLE8_9CARY|nr:hypothetical protein Cgig2_013844 [Carnegiea gigantea]
MSAFSAWYTAPCVHDIYIQLCLGERVKAHPHSVLLSRHAMVPLIFRWSSSLRRSRVPSGHLQNLVWGLTPAQCRKVKEVGDLMTGEPATEAPVNGGRNYNGLQLRWKAKKAPFRGGPEPSVRYHSGRASILTLCQDLRAKGQLMVDSFYGA